MTSHGITTRRLEAFSDAVLAVAITLMVLRIGTPTPAPGESMGHAFVNVTLPAIIYFLITFAVIVIFWTHHHDIFRQLPEMTPARAFIFNMGFLAVVCLLPFGLEFFTSDTRSYVTVAVYAGLMALASLMLGLLSREVTGTLPASVALSVIVFLLAIPFAGLLGGWCLLIWWIDEPIKRILRRRGVAV